MPEMQPEGPTMPEAFSISTAEKSIKLDAKARSGVVKYTVSHALPRTVAARADVVAEATTQAKWLTVKPDKTGIAQGANVSFTVSIAAPADVAPGKYRFHLRVVDDDNPDDLSTEGPTAEFEVAAAEPPPNGKVKWWIWLLVAVAALAVLGVGGWAVWCKALGKCGGGGGQLALHRPCTQEGQCAAGLTCAAIPGGAELECRRARNEGCVGGGECASYWCNAGRCMRDDGKCDSPGECRAPFVCESGMCLKSVGAECGADAECAAPGKCQAGRCAATNANPCTLRCPVGSRCDWSNGQQTCVRMKALIYDRRFTPNFEVLKRLPPGP